MMYRYWSDGRTYLVGEGFMLSMLPEHAVCIIPQAIRNETPKFLPAHWNLL